MLPPDCRAPAAYKIAARWSDGHLAELKTYGFACSEHLGAIFRDSEQRRSNYIPPGESIEELAIYRHEPGNATAFCNDCGGWKRITGRERRTGSSSQAIDVSRRGDRHAVRRAPLLTERLAQSSRGVLRWISVDRD